MSARRRQETLEQFSVPIRESQLPSSQLLGMDLPKTSSFVTLPASSQSQTSTTALKSRPQRLRKPTRKSVVSLDDLLEEKAESRCISDYHEDDFAMSSKDQDQSTGSTTESDTDTDDDTQLIATKARVKGKAPQKIEETQTQGSVFREIVGLTSSANENPKVMCSLEGGSCRLDESIRRSCLSLSRLVRLDLT
jgi:hypothetical protein